jgi:hypothetical protein
MKHANSVIWFDRARKYSSEDHAATCVTLLDISENDHLYETLSDWESQDYGDDVTS